MRLYKITATYSHTGKYVSWATSIPEVRRIQGEYASNNSNPKDRLYGTNVETLEVALKKPDFLAFLRDHTPGTENVISAPCAFDFTKMPGADEEPYLNDSLAQTSERMA